MAKKIIPQVSEEVIEGLKNKFRTMPRGTRFTCVVVKSTPSTTYFKAFLPVQHGNGELGIENVTWDIATILQGYRGEVDGTWALKSSGYNFDRIEEVFQNLAYMLFGTSDKETGEQNHHYFLTDQY
jgi:hypothetical protein